MDERTRKKLDRLDREMNKRYDLLRWRLPYGLRWLTQSADLFEWYEVRRKKLLSEKVATTK